MKQNMCPIKPQFRSWVSFNLRKSYFVKTGCVTRDLLTPKGSRILSIADFGIEIKEQVFIRDTDAHPHISHTFREKQCGRPGKKRAQTQYLRKANQAFRRRLKRSRGHKPQ
jgi:hypothetical protein